MQEDEIFENDSFKIEIDIDNELNDLLSEMEDIRESFNENKMDSLIDGCITVVVDTLIGPFGLSKSMFIDRDGGNVTTTHNFKKGIVANEGDKVKYEEYTKPFDRTPYKEGEPNRKKFFQNNETIVDGYTGKELPKDGRTQFDHITPVVKIDKDASSNLFLSKADRIKMVNHEDNITPTLDSLNMSKNSHDLKEWENKITKGDVKNKDRFDINEELSNQKYEQSNKFIKNTIDTAKFEKYKNELLITGSLEGAKLGFRQALGLILKELAEASFFEIRDCIKNKGQNDTILNEMKIRFSRIGERLQSKWKDILVDTGSGVLSGFLSNMVTTITNIFITTLKNIVKIIREGFNSIINSIKILVYPQGRSNKEIAEAILKIFATTLVTIVAISVEELIANAIKGIIPLAPFAHPIAQVTTGILAGLSSIFAIYMLDSVKSKIEFNHKQVMLASMSSVATQYQTLQTLFLLEKSINFTREMNIAIANSSMEFNNQLKLNEQNLETDVEEFNTLFDEFNEIMGKE